MYVEGLKVKVKVEAYPDSLNVFFLTTLEYLIENKIKSMEALLEKTFCQKIFIHFLF